MKVSQQGNTVILEDIKSNEYRFSEKTSYLCGARAGTGIGAYTGYFVLTATGPTPLGLVLAFLGAMVVCAVLSIAIERCAYRPLRAAPRLNSLITAIAVELILQNAMRVLPFVGPNPRQFPTMETKFFTFGSVQISNIQLIVIISSAVLMVILNYIINYTKTGRAMRAVSYDLGAANSAYTA